MLLFVIIMFFGIADSCSGTMLFLFSLFSIVILVQVTAIFLLCLFIRLCLLLWTDILSVRWIVMYSFFILNFYYLTVRIELLIFPYVIVIFGYFWLSYQFGMLVIAIIVIVLILYSISNMCSNMHDIVVRSLFWNVCCITIIVYLF